MKCLYASIMVISLLFGSGTKGADEMGRVACEVVLEDGKPAAGARVYICCVPDRQRILEEPLVAQGTTNEKGLFETEQKLTSHLPLFYGSVLAVSADGKAGGGQIVCVKGEAAKPLRLVLQPTTTFKARILRPDGSPAAGLKVWISKCDHAGAPDVANPVNVAMSLLPDGVWSAVTDAEGRCDIPQVFRGAAVYLSHGDARFAQLSGRLNQWSADAPRADGTTEHVLRLGEPGRLRGKIVLPDGTAAAGSVVQVLEHRPYKVFHMDTARADASGVFEFVSLPPGDYELNYDTQPPFNENWIGSEVSHLQVKAGEVTEAGNLQVSPPARVMVQGVDAESGTPVGKPQTCRLRAGEQQIPYWLTPELTARYHPLKNDDYAKIELKPGEQRSLSYKLRPIKPSEMILGVVQDSKGAPVANVTVAAVSDDSWDMPRPSRTAADGSFKITCPPEMTALNLIAWSDDKAMSNPVAAKAGTPVTLIVRQDGFARVTGHVRDEDGKPIKGAQIDCMIPGVEFGPVTGPVPQGVSTNAEGEFVFPRLWTATEEVTFFCSHPGHGSTSRRDIALPADQTLQLDMVLKKIRPEVGVTGVVVDKAGNPVEGVKIFLSGDELPAQRKSPVTNAKGEFAVMSLVPTRVYVEARHKNGSVTRKVAARIVIPGKPLRLVLPDGDESVSALIVDAQGKPAAGTVVRSFDRDLEVKAGPDGRLKMSGLVKGWFDLELTYARQGEATIKHRTRIKAGTKDVRLQLPAATREWPARPATPVDLKGVVAPELSVQTWLNSLPLPTKAGGKVRILDFWGVQCAPCIAAFPKVQAFWQKHDGQDLEIIALTSYPVEEVREFLAKHPDWKFPVAIVQELSTSFTDYDVRGVPTYIVVDATGRIRSQGHEWADAAKAAEQLLASLRARGP